MEPERRDRIQSLIDEGWEIWDRFDRTVREKRFHPFVASEYEQVRDALEDLEAPGRRFLEWGSASGVITIMADLLGFEAYGIEIDPSLVRTARELATRHGSGAVFVEGSFVPAGFPWPAAPGGQEAWTEQGVSAYATIGHSLDDFDVVFAYPWKGEEAAMRELMRTYGRPDARLVLHDVHGVRVL